VLGRAFFHHILRLSLLISNEIVDSSETEFFKKTNKNQIDKKISIQIIKIILSNIIDICYLLRWREDIAAIKMNVCTTK